MHNAPDGPQVSPVSPTPAGASAAQPADDPRLSIGSCATLACLLEATAAKPGNVYRAADFDDMTYADMLVSATVIGPAMEAAVDCGVGQAVLHAVRATQAAVGTNTNLGTLLLLAPLAKVSRDLPLRAGIEPVLADLTPQDAAAVYTAIRAARPGGLGHVPEADVHNGPPAGLREAMALAADRDLVARQYANGYHEVFDRAVPLLTAGQQRGWSLDRTIVHAQMELLAELPDSLIARKCGLATAQEASARAALVLAAGAPGDQAYQRAVADLDFWLRADGHRRNPGTTADLLAAALFALLRDRRLAWPLRFYATPDGT